MTLEKRNHLYAITPQNEPDVTANGYSGMIFPSSDEANFIANYLGPALSQANLSPKIWAWDSNTLLSNVETILNNSAASHYISGVAWHCYGGNLQMLSTIHDAYPGKDQYETECSTGPTGIAPYSAIDVALDSVQNWAKTVELWNLALDTHDGPMMGVGCNSCTGLAAVPGTKVQLWTCWGGANQKWMPQANGSLLNPQSGLCLDDPAGNTANGTQLQIWNCNNLWPQVYQLP